MPYQKFNRKKRKSRQTFTFGFLKNQIEDKELIRILDSPGNCHYPKQCETRKQL